MNRYQRRGGGRRQRPSPAARVLSIAHKDGLNKDGLDGVTAAFGRTGTPVEPMSLLACITRAVLDYGFDPHTAVVYRGDVHGVATLQEYLTAAFGLPVDIRHERRYVLTHDGRRATITLIPDEMAAYAPGEGPDVSVVRLVKVAMFLPREDAQALFNGPGPKPERLWPVEQGGRIEFAGLTGEGHVAATLEEALDYTWDKCCRGHDDAGDTMMSGGKH